MWFNFTHGVEESMAERDEYADEAAFLRGGGATGELIAKFDWASTSLGALRAWPQCLRTATALVLRSPVAMALLWGGDGVMIYNDAYARIAGDRHPELLGANVRDAWPEIADLDDQVMKKVLGGAKLQFRDRQLTLRRSDKLEQLWFNLDYSPVLDEAGQPAGVLAIVVETTRRVTAERRAAAHLERQQRMFQQAPGFICFLRGPGHVFEFRNEAHLRLFGEREAIGKSRHEIFADLPDEGFRELLDNVYATGERYVAQARRYFVRPRLDMLMEERFLDFVLQPVTDEAGKVIGIFVEGFDVTQQIRAKEVARESERQLTAAFAVARLGGFVWDRVTREAALDARAREIFGFGHDEPVTVDDVVARIDPRDRHRAFSEIRDRDEAGQTRREIEYRIRLHDGTIRNVLSISDIFGGPHGPTSRALGVFNDVTDRRVAEKRQRMLINELNHRVKNTLATVQSIAAQTLRSAPDLPSAREAFEARLVALAAAHDLLTAQSWHGARLSDVVATALAPFETTQRPQISRAGPPVWVGAQRALALSLALYELATNAAKYGALSLPEGKVTIRWTMSADELILSWLEEGGPPVKLPARSGFGTRLLQRSLARELQGEVSLAYAPGGIRCEIRCPAEEAGPVSRLS
jgi:PAS domain S-box-containing protein